MNSLSTQVFFVIFLVCSASVYCSGAGSVSLGPDPSVLFVERKTVATHSPASQSEPDHVLIAELLAGRKYFERSIFAHKSLEIQKKTLFHLMYSYFLGNYHPLSKGIIGIHPSLADVGRLHILYADFIAHLENSNPLKEKLRASMTNVLTLFCNEGGTLHRFFILLIDRDAIERKEALQAAKDSITKPHNDALFNKMVSEVTDHTKFFDLLETTPTPQELAKQKRYLQSLVDRKNAEAKAHRDKKEQEEKEKKEKEDRKKAQRAERLVRSQARKAAEQEEQKKKEEREAAQEEEVRKKKEAEQRKQQEEREKQQRAEEQKKKEADELAKKLRREHQQREQEKREREEKEAAEVQRKAAEAKEAERRAKKELKKREKQEARRSEEVEQMTREDEEGRRIAAQKSAEKKAKEERRIEEARHKEEMERVAAEEKEYRGKKEEAVRIAAEERKRYEQAKRIVAEYEHVHLRLEQSDKQQLREAIQQKYSECLSSYRQLYGYIPQEVCAELQRYTHETADSLVYRLHPHALVVLSRNKATEENVHGTGVFLSTLEHEVVLTKLKELHTLLNNMLEARLVYQRRTHRAGEPAPTKPRVMPSPLARARALIARKQAQLPETKR